MLRDAPNVQSLWGDLIVEELVRNSVDRFVVAPGSRSTPLVQAVAKRDDVDVVLWGDERGAAYHALGHARAWTLPAAVITTSGTAVANLLPAVVEASLDGVPLILLTADRPPELREVGANQSIRQLGIFSDHVRWAFDLPVPSDQTPARVVLTTVDHAVARARQGFPGPVQINCPFREPLAPEPAPWDAGCLDGLDAWRATSAPFTWSHDLPNPCPLHDDEPDELAEAAKGAASGMLVAGSDLQGCDSGNLAVLAQKLGWPLWGDVRSQIRFGNGSPFHLPHLDRMLGNGFAPEFVIQIGSRLTSKRLQAWLDAGHAKRYVLVERDPGRHDPGHRVTDRFVADPEHWVDTLDEIIDSWHEEPPASLAAENARLEEAVEKSVADSGLSEPWVARWLSRNLDPEHGLFVSSSMPIRDVQAYGVTDGPEIPVAANRGASGIDGVVSTAAGYAQGCGKPTTLLIGDLAMLHDLNALAFLRDLPQPLTIVVLNNGGGSIFSFLPIANHQELLNPYVSTPHALRFEGVCSSFEIPYERVEDREAFETAYRKAAASGESSMIEVASSLESNLAHHRRIEEAIEKALGEETS